MSSASASTHLEVGEHDDVFTRQILSRHVRHETAQNRPRSLGFTEVNLFDVLRLTLRGESSVSRRFIQTNKRAAKRRHHRLNQTITPHAPTYPPPRASSRSTPCRRVNPPVVPAAPTLRVYHPRERRRRFARVSAGRTSSSASSIGAPPRHRAP